MTGAPPLGRRPLLRGLACSIAAGSLAWSRDAAAFAPSCAFDIIKANKEDLFAEKLEAYEIKQVVALTVFPLLRRLALVIQTPRPLDRLRWGEARRLFVVIEQKAWDATKKPKAVEAAFMKMVVRHKAPEDELGGLRAAFDTFLHAGGDLPADKSLFGAESALGTGDPFGPTARFAGGLDPFVTAHARFAKRYTSAEAEALQPLWRKAGALLGNTLQGQQDYPCPRRESRDER